MFLLTQLITFRMNLYELKENRIMRPKTFSAMLSNLLYEKRFGPYFIEPVIAGLDPLTNQPYVCNMDLVSTLKNYKFNPIISKLAVTMTQSYTDRV